MAEKQWSFTSNQFEVCTRTSNVKMLSISTDTDSKLAAETSDPDIAAIYNDYHSLHTAYQQICGNYDGMAGARKGKTLNIEILMKDTLPVELRKWVAAAGVVYVIDSPQWVSFFPQKRKPFLQGRYEDRINAIYTLYKELQNDPMMAALAVQVQSFYNVILSARDTQQQKEGLLGQLSDLREQQRIITAQGLYGFVLAPLMRKYKSDTSQIERFFNLSIIRQSKDFISASSIVIKGRITFGISTPVVGALVAVQGQNPPAETTLTDEDGKFEFIFNNVEPSEAGNATLTVTAQGFNEHTQQIFVELAHAYTFNITLSQALQIAA